MELPRLIAALNHAQNEQDAEASASCFTDDAVLHDEPEEVVPISFDHHFQFAGSLMQRLAIRLALPQVAQR